VFFFFEHQDAGAFAHDKPMATFVERTARFGRIAVDGSGQRSGIAESGDGIETRGGFRAACEHDIGISAFNHHGGCRQ